jgi:hypothetical protein
MTMPRGRARAISSTPAIPAETAVQRIVREFMLLDYGTAKDLLGVLTTIQSVRVVPVLSVPASLIAPPVGGLGDGGSPIDPASVPPSIRRVRVSRRGLPPAVPGSTADVSTLPDQGTPGDDDEIVSAENA